VSDFVKNLVRRAAGRGAGGEARPAMSPEALPLAVDAVPAALEQPAAPLRTEPRDRRAAQPAVQAPARELPQPAEPQVGPATPAPPRLPVGVAVRPVLNEPPLAAGPREPRGAVETAFRAPAVPAPGPAERPAAAARRAVVNSPNEAQTVWAEIRPAVVEARLPLPVPAASPRAGAEPPPVEVHIDSIEVRAPAPPPAPAPAPVRPAPAPAAGFDSYQRIRSYRGWDRVGDRS